MNQTDSTSRADALSAAIRGVRANYDRLSSGEVAVLRRCKTADDVALDGTYWRIAATLARAEPHLSHVVLLFPLAPQKAGGNFTVGNFLRRKLGDDAGAQLRFRRVMDSHDRDDLDHRLRRVLRLACADGSALDWGILGRDLLWFFAESGNVRRSWAQNFYAPSRADSTAISTSNA